MFTPQLAGSRNSSRSVVLDSPIVESYLQGLLPADLARTQLLEALHTRYGTIGDIPVSGLDDVVETIRDTAGWWRDPMGTLVAHEHREFDADRLWLLWPVARPLPAPTEYAVIEGCGHDAAFVRYEDSGTVIPLPATNSDAKGFRWGYIGSGGDYLYRALVYAVTGEQLPVQPVEIWSTPGSLKSWIKDLGDARDFRLTWPELVAKVERDRPIREAVKRAHQ